MKRTVPLAVATSVGAGAATAIPIFMLPAAVAAGISVSNGGWLLAGGSAAAVLGRLGSGWYADRIGGAGLNIIWLMMVLGCAGCGLLALDGTVFLVVGAVIAYACGFGWTGLLNFATVLLNPNAPASAAGLVQSGGAGGAALAPVVFGSLSRATPMRRGGWRLAARFSSPPSSFSTSRRCLPEKQPPGEPGSAMTHGRPCCWSDPRVTSPVVVKLLVWFPNVEGPPCEAS
jgi:MFS family permease